MIYAYHLIVCLILILFQTTLLAVGGPAHFYDLLVPFVVYLGVHRLPREAIPVLVIAGSADSIVPAVRRAWRKFALRILLCSLYLLSRRSFIVAFHIVLANRRAEGPYAFRGPMRRRPQRDRKGGRRFVLPPPARGTIGY